MKKRTKQILCVVLALAALAGLTALRSFLQELDKEAEVKSSRQYAPEAPADHPALLWYQEQYPDKEILLACADDLTADGLEDLVVIYRIEKGAAEAVALLSREDGGYDVTPLDPRAAAEPENTLFQYGQGA